MPVEDVAARVLAALSRAESLFARPAGTERSAGAAARISDAAAASRAIAPHSADLSGAAAAAHGEMLSAAGERLAHADATDSELARQLTDAAETHRDGRAHATELRTTAAEIPATLGPAMQLPAGEVAALRGLRNRVAAMQALVARHSAESARLASDLRNLGYPR
jgi:hypothetical protein